jgi:hypothetical protein
MCLRGCGDIQPGKAGQGQEPPPPLHPPLGVQPPWPPSNYGRYRHEHLYNLLPGSASLASSLYPPPEAQLSLLGFLFAMTGTAVNLSISSRGLSLLGLLLTMVGMDMDLSISSMGHSLLGLLHTVADIDMNLSTPFSWSSASFASSSIWPVLIWTSIQSHPEAQPPYSGRLLTETSLHPPLELNLLGLLVILADQVDLMMKTTKIYKKFFIQALQIHLLLFV